MPPPLVIQTSLEAHLLLLIFQKLSGQEGSLFTPCTCMIAYFILLKICYGSTIYKLNYFQHPITRFIARYIQTSHQQEYEKYMHYMYEEDERAKTR